MNWHRQSAEWSIRYWLVGAIVSAGLADVLDVRAQAPLMEVPLGYYSLPTNTGRGADAEVREERPGDNFGASTELATRLALGTRNSVMYLQFDLQNVRPEEIRQTVLRLTYRNTNWSSGRVHDKDFIDPDLQSTGLEYYGVPGAMFNESTITYANAPGLTPDAVIGTKDFADAATVRLGMALYHEIGLENHYPVGGAFDFDGLESQPALVEMSLDTFLLGELATNPHRVAVIAAVHLHEGAVGEPAAWSNHNYLFNPKEQTTLNADPTYDSNDLDALNPLGNLNGGQPNNGRYSPQLLLWTVPEPATAAPAALGGIALLRRRRR